MNGDSWLARIVFCAVLGFCGYWCFVLWRYISGLLDLF